MSEVNGFSGWERAEALDWLKLEESATHEQRIEIASIGRDICFDSEDYVVGAIRGPERAVTFIDEDRHVTVLSQDSRMFCDLDITIDQRDREDGELVVRKVFEVQNASWFRKNAAKIAITPYVKFIVDDEEIDVGEVFPKNKPSRLYSWRARSDYNILKRRSLTTNEFTVADYQDINKGLLAYGAMKRVFACGKEAAKALKVND